MLSIHLLYGHRAAMCIYLALGSLQAQNGVASTCVAGGSAFLVVIAAIRCSSESYSFTMYLRILGPGRTSTPYGMLHLFRY